MDLIAIRKKLHSIAELAHQERKTAGFVAQLLRESGITDIQDNIGGQGLVATADSGRPGPALLFRAELDALPIDETLSLPYASENSNIAHKCGHDGHMTILIGLAKKLQKKPLKRGKVHFLFQPAEETGEGAARMLEDPGMPDINPDFVFALHNLPGYPLKAVLLRNDVFAAGSAGLIIRLTGNTAHAAHPEQGRSPAQAVATLIQKWEALPGKVLPADQFGLVTVIHTRIGDRAFGTTPGFAELMATIRAWEPGDFEKLRREAVKIAEKTAANEKLQISHEWTEEFQPTCNHPDAVSLIERAAKKRYMSGSATAKRAADEGETTGSESIENGIIWMKEPFSWSEDFARFTERYPGALFGIGAGTGHPHLHDTRYDFPDETLEHGVHLFFGIIEETGLF